MKDRWISAEKNFGMWNVERFNAIKAFPGIEGCNKSHLECLKIAKERNLDWFLLLEDDCELLSPSSKAQFEMLLPALWKNRDKWDIFSGGSSYVTETRGPCYRVNDCTLVEVKGLAAHFMLFHKDTYEKIIKQYALTPMPIDVLYRNHFRVWTSVPFLARQIPGYSSCMAEAVNYDGVFANSLKYITSAPQWKHQIDISCNTPTICLTMIVKNEAHLIIKCFDMLTKYIKFDYWAINDNGSTDGTQQLIKDYFAKKGIPGVLDETPWKDFSFNRTKAFEVAYKKTDYAFVWDADDEILGDFKLPDRLTADSYKFIFGHDFKYCRPQLFNNRLKWQYKGVLHEYPACLEKAGEPVEVVGNYFFVSGRSGARNKNPNKYLEDALLLEAAFEEAFTKKDPLHNRYCFYTAQSYSCCNNPEKSIHFYKKVLDLDNWTQEKYVACVEIYDEYEKLGKNKEGMHYLIESLKYDKQRIEGVFRLIKFYCIHGQPEVSLAFYALIADQYETLFKQNSNALSKFLFAKKSEYVFYLPYYMVIVALRVNRHDICIKMLEIIFQHKFWASEWWIHNLFFNIQFVLPRIELNLHALGLNFLESMLEYIQGLRKRGVHLNSNNNKNVDLILAKFRPLLALPSDFHYKAPLPELPESLGPEGVLFTITTCKRFNLFEQTMNSILNTWLDLDKVSMFFCVDDNSSEEDREKMKKQYPFFRFYMKSPQEKGHRESMNLIWEKVKQVNPKYWIHLEDDWLFFKKEKYITRAIAALEKYENKNIHQIVFNREYGLMMNDIERVNVMPLGSNEEALGLHLMGSNFKGINCAYWPHYSLQPSLSRTSALLKLGDFTSRNQFFERDYAEKYSAAGYQTAFFDFIHSLHIGKQHWEKEGQNAYSLNSISQGTTAQGTTAQ